MSYEVKLQDFEGPLDLLLHLIQKNEVDIYDIPIAQITDQYLDHLMRMQELNLELAGEFLLMAATLIYIKSKMLLPQPPSPPEEEATPEDPRQGLVERLVEYKKYKEAALFLERKEDEFRLQLTSQPQAIPEGPEVLDPEADLFRLLSVFYGLLRKADQESPFLIDREELDIRQSMVEILDRIAEKESLTLRALLGKGRSRLQMIVTFLGLLELIRGGILKVRQYQNFGEIRIYRSG